MMNLGAMSEAVAMAAGINWNNGSSIFDDWNQGGIELYAVIGELAQTSSDLVEDIIKNTGVSIPGVWAYEVSETFGTEIESMIDKYKTDFDLNLAKVKLGEFAYKFFDDYPEDQAKVAPFIAKWTNFIK